jgi:hypothetical protein
MKNLATLQRYTQPELEYGLVVAATSEDFSVAIDGAAYQAKKAVSCLVLPEPGDTVMLAFDASPHCYILSVLERPGGALAAKTLAFDGQVNLRIRQGGLNIATDQTLSLTSEQKIALASDELELDARNGSARITTFSFLGRMFQSQVETVKQIADTLDTIIRRSVQRLTSSYRYIEEHEEIQSASTRMLVEGTLTMQTQNTMHTAEGHIKIDAEQIHLG